MASITITFINPVPLPLLGFRIRYREVGTSTWNEVLPNPSGSPVVINDLPFGKNWEGTIESRCSTNSYSAPVPFLINDAAANAYEVSGRAQESATLAASDAIVAQRTYYSPCETLAPGCPIYTNAAMTNLLTGYQYVALFGQVWTTDSAGHLVAFVENYILP